MKTQHQKHSIWDHLKPDSFKRAMGWLIAIIVIAAAYMTWDYYQTPQSVRGCDKSTFPDSNDVLWKCAK